TVTLQSNPEADPTCTAIVTLDICPGENCPTSAACDAANTGPFTMTVSGTPAGIRDDVITGVARTMGCTWAGNDAAGPLQFGTIYCVSGEAGDEWAAVAYEFEGGAYYAWGAAVSGPTPPTSG